MEDAADGRADIVCDRRYRALVLLATFASLRWGEATALRRCDLDLGAGRSGCARLRRALDREMLLGPPKSKAGRRVVGIPDAIIPALREHLSVFARDEPGALVFPGQRAARCGAATLQDVRLAGSVRTIGSGLHFHDLRHTGNHFAAPSGAGLKDLMARMGHDSERAALIYQHEVRGADKGITGAIDAQVQAERREDDDDDDGPAGVLVPAG